MFEKSMLNSLLRYCLLRQTGAVWRSIIYPRILFDFSAMFRAEAAESLREGCLEQRIPPDGVDPGPSGSAVDPGDVLILWIGAVLGVT
jgi:hypothetical protein